MEKQYGIQELWADLESVLTSAEGVKHIDLWNRNVEYIEEDAAWERPAVFVEFGQIDWKPLKEDGTYRGRGTVFLHVVTDWDGDMSVTWQLQRIVSGAVMSLCGEWPMVMLQSRMNHDHEEIVETIVSFDTRYLINVNE